MLPKQLRLSRKGFEEVVGLRRTHTPHFSITFGPAKGHIGGSAVIVSKRVTSKSVARHALKRRVREILRPWTASNRILIVSAKKGADTLSFNDIQNELSAAFAAIISQT